MESPTLLEILKSTLVSLMRHLISILAAYLISKGLVAPQILSEGNIAVLAAGAAAALISVGLIVYKKLDIHRLIEAARNAPAGQNMDAIKADAKATPLLGTGDGK